MIFILTWFYPLYMYLERVQITEDQNFDSIGNFFDAEQRKPL